MTSAGRLKTEKHESLTILSKLCGDAKHKLHIFEMHSFDEGPVQPADSKLPITKTYLCNFDPLKPYFYIVKLGFKGVYIIFLMSTQNIDCGYLLELPR